MGDVMKRPRLRGRTGCRTCRVRRIKCDEGRPDCRRCSSTGRTCDGYEVVHVPVAKRQLHPKVRLLSSISIGLPITVSQVDHDAFIFFRDQTAREIPGCFQSGLWDQLVLQIGHREPSIAHAIIAVGSMHQSSRGQLPSLQTDPFESRHPFAITHYVKALHHLRQLLSADDNVSIHVPLIACLLFMALEMLQGNQLGAVAHLQMGLRILAGIPSLFDRRGHIQDRTVLLGSTASSIVSQLAAAFATLDYEATMFGEQRPAVCLLPQINGIYQDLDIPDVFSSIAEARYNLDVLSNGVFSFRGELLQLAGVEISHMEVDWAVRHCMQHTYARTVDLGVHVELLARLISLRNGVSRWTSAFKPLSGSLCVQSKPILLLEIRHFFVEFYISTCQETAEVSCDRFNNTFKRIVSLATIYVQHLEENRSPEQSALTFTLESGIIPSLYLIGVKCRDPVIRREAISLLNRTPCQEGMWEGTLMARFVQQAADCEEAAASQPVVHSGDVPELARYSEVVLVRSERPGYGKLICSKIFQGKSFRVEVVEREVLIGGS